MRVFLAIELGDVVNERLCATVERMGAQAPRARWVRPGNFHLTLSFLGEIPDAVIPKISDGLARACSAHAPFTMRVRGSGTFGSLHAPRVLWAGIAEGSDPLVAFEASLARELSALGLAEDRERFVPHVTLARSKQPRGESSLAECARQLLSFDFGEVAVHDIAIFASEQTPKGMHYRALVTHALGRR